MKVFDAHCHIYPTKIAQKAAAATSTFYDNLGETYDGTVQTLFAKGAGIDRFLVQSVATRPEHENVHRIQRRRIHLRLLHR